MVGYLQTLVTRRLDVMSGFCVVLMENGLELIFSKIEYCDLLIEKVILLVFPDFQIVID